MKKSSLLESILPPKIATSEASISEAYASRILEIDLVRGCKPQRINEFATGRACAEFATIQLSSVKRPVMRGTRGEPLWPAGIIGSITHTRDICYCAVAFNSHYSSLGIDCERIKDLNDDIWNIIFTRDEIEYLTGTTSNLKQIYAATIFSAKESYYKMQFPLTKRWLNFQDVNITLEKGKLMANELITPNIMSKHCAVGAHIADGNNVLTAFWSLPSTRE